MNFPADCTAGLTFQASARFAAYPAPDWALTVHLRGAGKVDLVADATGTFVATSSETRDWVPGDYWYSLRATRGDDVIEAATGMLVVRPDLAAAGAGFDGRTENEQALAAIEAVLAKKATQDQMRYTIRTPSGERELWRTPIADLLSLRAHYRREVSRERAAASGKRRFGRQIQVKFR